MSEELTQLLKELTQIVNNFTIRGESVAGDIKSGYIVNTPPNTPPEE